jgi:hypothetical protein
MKQMIKKIFVSILSIGIVLSSTGITIISHICKQEQKVVTSVQRFDKSTCQHDSNGSSCCCNEAESCCNENFVVNPSQTDNSHNAILNLKNAQDCCKEIKTYNKLEVVSNENTLKKFVEQYKPTFSVEYFKNLTENYLVQQFEKIETKFINPTKKIIRLIQLSSRLFSSSDDSPSN